MYSSTIVSSSILFLYWGRLGGRFQFEWMTIDHLSRHVWPIFTPSCGPFNSVHHHRSELSNIHHHMFLCAFSPLPMGEWLPMTIVFIYLRLSWFYQDAIIFLHIRSSSPSQHHTHPHNSFYIFPIFTLSHISRTFYNSITSMTHKSCHHARRRTAAEKSHREKVPILGPDWKISSTVQHHAGHKQSKKLYV